MTVLLRAERLFRFFHTGAEEVVALADVSLELQAGEVVAMVGPSGSGKSTLLSCLAGLDEPDGGTVTVAGARMTRRTEAERSALRATHIGMMWQTGNLLDHLSVRENVLVAQRLARRANSARADEILTRLGLSARAHARPRVLSGGETARAALAVATANEPDVLLADEPTGELDRAAAATVVGLLRERADRGAGVLIVTHSPEVAAVADRVLVLSDGRLVA